jgi:hypothetical protein
MTTMRERRLSSRLRARARSIGWLLALLAWSLATSTFAQLRVDGVAAVVGAVAPGPSADVVLHSDVELRARLSLLSRQGDPGELSPLPKSLLRATLAEIVGELLIAREARRLQAATPSGNDVERERVRLLRAAGGQGRVDELLFALSADHDELHAIARRRALVASFLSANLEGVTEVTDAALDQALAADPMLLEGRTREQARVELRARMSREALDRTIARWVAVLKARTEVHLYAEP